jgi:uncharacterized membrane protein
MRAFRTVVVAVILSAMFSPAIGLANTESATAPVPARQIVQTGVTLAGAVASTANALNTQNTQSSESSQYAQREQQSKDVQDFKGGAVYYIGGATLVLLIILLIILI